MCNSVKNMTAQYKLHCSQALQWTTSLSFLVSHTAIHSYQLNISITAWKSILDMINLITQKTHCRRDGKMFPDSIRCLTCSLPHLAKVLRSLLNLPRFSTLCHGHPVSCKWSDSRFLSWLNSKEQFWVDWRWVVQPIQMPTTPPAVSQLPKSQK